MFINKNIIIVEFIRRPNRFQAYVIINGEETLVHVPNTGRCKEILIPHTKVVLRQEDNPNRKTKYDLIGGYKGNKFINIDSQIPNKVVEEALREGKIKGLEEYNIIQREKTFGNSRFDFKLQNLKGEEYYLEVKGVTFEEDGVARFPDAPTERGKKHLLELIDVKESGRGAGVMFVIQLEDVKFFTPYDEMDMEFGKALRLASKNGVDIFAYNSHVGEKFITLKDEVEVRL